MAEQLVLNLKKSSNFSIFSRASYLSSFKKKKLIHKHECVFVIKVVLKRESFNLVHFLKILFCLNKLNAKLIFIWEIGDMFVKIQHLVLSKLKVIQVNLQCTLLAIAS